MGKEEGQEQEPKIQYVLQTKMEWEDGIEGRV